MRRRLNVTKLLLRRPRGLPPRPAPTYVSLRTVIEQNLRVSLDVIAPADKHALSADMMQKYDRCPRPVRMAIGAAAWDVGVDWIVSLIDRGAPVERVVYAIARRMSAETEKFRAKGLLPPAAGFAERSAA